MRRHTLEPRGPFSLAAAARFIAGWPAALDRGGADEEVRLAFLVDDWSGPAEVVLRQDGDGVHAEVAADNEARALARAALREPPGIGPFHAALILLRAVGTTGVLATKEPRLQARVKERYGAELEDVADARRPFRTWVSVLLRATG